MENESKTSQPAGQLPERQMELRRQNRATVMPAMLLLLTMITTSFWLGCAGDPPDSGPPPPPADPSQCDNGIAVPSPQENEELVQDCQVLMRARDILAEPGRLYWDTQTPIDEWRGVIVSKRKPPRRVTHLLLSLPILRGALPAGLGQLSGLEVLDLSNSQLEGQIPAEYGALAILRVLDLGNNFLTGTIPPELGRLARCRHWTFPITV